jgi:DNA-binding transcriptional ArsR family regulator
VGRLINPKTGWQPVCNIADIPYHNGRSRPQLPCRGERQVSTDYRRPLLSKLKSCCRYQLRIEPADSRPPHIRRRVVARRLKPLPGLELLYTLTRICSLGYIKRVESVFEIVAEPNRRAILSLLVSSQQSVGEIERQLRMSQPTVSKHLRVLREAGFVESTVDAQRRLYRLKPEPFREMDAWLSQFRRFWSTHVDALERYLDRMGQSREDRSTPTKRKTTKKPTRPKPRRDKGETK